MLRPFWPYYGGKWRAVHADAYPQPLHETIVEPFAGAAGYSMRWGGARNVVLVEKYAVVAAIWRYLIGVDAAEIRAIPLVTSVDDLPEWVPQAARWLVGFNLNGGSATPKRTLSKQPRGHGWHAERRERVASQLEHIRHWKIIEGDYTLAPDIEATWFIDSVYQKAGRHYLKHRIDFAQLGAWCRSRRGQPIVCEQYGADWLSFRKLGAFKSGPKHRRSVEAVWP